MNECVRLSGANLVLAIKAVPGSSRSQLAGVQNGRLRVKIAAAPEDGKANTELCSFLAKLLGCPKKDISLLSGERSRLKTLCLPQSCMSRLEAVIGTDESAE
jgi:uncharacterized protein (TIGR00251 family)